MADITTINPATGKELTTYDYMSESDVNNIIDASHTAFLDWRLVDLDTRAKAITAISKVFDERKEELAKLMTTERGKLYEQSLQEIDLCMVSCDYTANVGVTELADEEREIDGMKKGIVTYQPLGIVYGIQPWNFPAYQVVRYAIASLMAGNAILLKHAANVTGSALLIEDIIQTGLANAGASKDLFRTLVISHDLSDKVIAHDKVRGITFTGSNDGGKVIAEKAAKVTKKTVLELGSNDAFIVLADADLDVAVETCVQARLTNNGETCVAAKRFVIVDDIYDDFTERMVKRFSEFNYGDPMSEDVQMGALAREDLRKTLHKQVQESVDKGAKILVGGEIPDGEGYFYPATILADVQKGQPAYDDELFGPVASFIRAKDTDDAMRLANDSRYGLGGAIFSKDEDNAIRLASQYFDTGMVYINGYGLANPALPFGGVKDSGYGREHGGFGIKEFVNAKGLHVFG